MVAEYRTGDLMFLDKENPLVLLGLDLVMGDQCDVLLSQEWLTVRTKEAGPTEILRDGRLIAKVGKLKTFYRKFTGCLIWHLRTRFDIGFQVTDYATTAPYVLDNPVEILAVAKSINRIAKSLKSRSLSIRYGSFPLKGEVVDLAKLRGLRIFIFSAAGYASL